METVVGPYTTGPWNSIISSPSVLSVDNTKELKEALTECLEALREIERDSDDFPQRASNAAAAASRALGGR